MKQANPSYSRIVGAIYEAALDPAQWRPMLAELRAECGAAAVIWGCVDSGFEPREFFAQDGLPDDAWANFLRAHVDNPFSRTLLRAPVGKPYLRSHYLPDDGYRASHFYRDIGRHFEMDEQLGLVPFRSQTRFAGLGMGYRDSDAAARDLPLFREIAPHLERALRVQRTLWDKLEPLATVALESLRCAVLTLDRTGRVTFANRRAEAILRRGDVVRCATGGRLRARDSLSDRGLQEQLELSLKRRDRVARPTVVRVRSVGNGWAALTVAPIPPSRAANFAIGAARAIVLIHGPSPKIDGAAVEIARAFGLTAREGRLVEQLLMVGSLPRAAHALGMAESTARHHMKAVHAKLGVANQIALASKILSASVLYLGDD